MATASPGLDSLSKYLRTDFGWKKDYVCVPLNQTFTYQEVKDAMKKLKKTDRNLHRLLEYRWMTNRSRSAISSALYLDSSTLKRQWDRAMNIVINWLVHGVSEDGEEPLLDPLDSLDLIEWD